MTLEDPSDAEAAAAMRAKLEQQKQRLAAMKQQRALRNGKREVTAWVRTASTRNLQLDDLEGAEEPVTPEKEPERDASGTTTNATTSTGDSTSGVYESMGGKRSSKITPQKTDTQKVDHILMLRSVASGNRAQKQNQERAIQMFTALDIPHKVLDCALPENKEERDKLFQVSGVRGNYPQFFTCTKEYSEDEQWSRPKYEYVGQYYNMQQINENSTMDASLLMHFDMTWDKLMGSTDTQLYYHKVMQVKRNSTRKSMVGEAADAAVKQVVEEAVETMSENTLDPKEKAAKVIQKFLLRRTPWWKPYRKRKAELEYILSAIPQETKAELEKLQADIKRQKEEFNAEDDEIQAVETSQKNAKKLMKKLEKEKKKEIQYQKEHKHETKRSKLIKKVNKLQEKTDKHKASFFKVKNKVFKQEGTARRLEENIEQVVEDNQRILSTIQSVAEKLDEHNLSWNEIKELEKPIQPVPVVKKQWWIPESKPAAPGTGAGVATSAVSPVPTKAEDPTKVPVAKEGMPRVTRPTGERKQLTKKQASRRALMLEESSQPSAVWSRSGGGAGGVGGRRATLLLGGLAKQKKAELDASLHKK